MQITRGYKTELDLNHQQMTACKQHAGAARWAWNWGLHRKQEVYQQTGRSISAMELHRELNVLKQTNVPWMYTVSKCAPQEALRDLDTAMSNFFRRAKLKKEGKWKGKTGYPCYKSKKRSLGSFRLTGAIHVTTSTVQLPRLGRLRLKERGYLPTSGVKVLSATVSEQAGRWFVSVQVLQEVSTPTAATGSPLGVDLGIKLLAVCSNGIPPIENPKALRTNLTKLKRACRRLSRRKKGSRNRAKARKLLSRQHARIANIRRDALHKATATITAKAKPDGVRPCVIVLEDLAITNMVKNRKLSRAISDVGMGEFRRQMAYKTLWNGEDLLIADRFYPSTKRCSACGCVKATMELSERVYVCDNEACGLIIDRDFNAALNLAALAT
jgi:IS605 OrfB family transposase